MIVSRDILEPQMQPSLEEFKNHIRVTSDDLDADLVPKLKAAIGNAEKFIGKVIALSVFVQKERLSSSSVRLRSPLVEVEGVEVDGEPAEEYSVVDNRLILPASLTGRQLQVRYVAGMPDVPYDIRAAVLMMAASLFNNPVDSVETLPRASSRLLRPYRSWGLDNGE